MTVRARWLLGLVSFLIVFHSLLAYGLPAGVFVLIVIALAVLFYRIGTLAALTVALAFLGVTLLYAGAIHLGGFESAMYYRPHEMLAAYDYTHNHRVYRPNAEVAMRMPHGDLQSMTTAKIAQPREVVFRTDSIGFRNDADYHGQRYVLVGDSFIAGLVDTQEMTLNEQLARDFGIDTYNLGFQGDLNDYVSYIEGFRARHGENFQVLLFLFEGNDFPDVLPELKRKRLSRFSLFWKRYYNLFSETSMFRLTRSMINRAKRIRSIASSESVRLHEVDGERMGFYVPYIDVSQRTEYRPVPEVERALVSIVPRLKHIFFIPTKYRVYHGYVAPGERLPHAQWSWLEDLCRRHGLHCTDLTPALIEASDRLLRERRFTWWRDDTHWNADGMAVAARVVAGVLKHSSQ